MGDVIFACNRDNYQARQKEFRGPKRQEYYEGEYLILPSNDVDVRIEKMLDCVYPIFNLRTRTATIFNRSWSHIQKDKTDLAIIWFVKHGRVTISDSGGTQSIEPGECAITRSLQPFRMENLVNEDSLNEVLHVIVPTHVLRSYIPDAVSSGTAFSFRQGNCYVAERTLAMLCEQGAHVDRPVAEEMMRAAFTALGHAMSTSSQTRAPRTLSERRLHDILACIETHLSNPGLAAATVARHCGISDRYLYSIFKSQQTSFMHVVWNRRLEKAKQWLIARDLSHLPIANIAYMAGFKSPAHFSRMFKRVMTIAPQDFRAQSRT